MSAAASSTAGSAAVSAAGFTISPQSSSVTTHPDIARLLESLDKVAIKLSDLFAQMPAYAIQLAICMWCVVPPEQQHGLDLCKQVADAIAQFEKLSVPVLNAIRTEIQSLEAGKRTCDWVFTEAEYHARRVGIGAALLRLKTLDVQTKIEVATELICGIWKELDENHKYRPFVKEDAADYPVHGASILSHCGYSESTAYLLALYLVLEVKPEVKPEVKLEVEPEEKPKE